MSLRSLVRKALYTLGLERVRTPNFVDLMRREGISTVLDVGANEGQFARELRLFGYRGEIVSFEPMRGAYDKLSASCENDSRWTARHMALGAKNGKEELNVSNVSVFNSFKPLSGYSEANFPGAKQSSVETVDVRRLDTLIAVEPALARDAYLKIDTQGFEREVLEGAGDCLGLFRAIQLELPLKALYAEQPLLTEMIRWMEDRGFALAMAKENGFDADAVRLLELDAVFVPRDRA